MVVSITRVKNGEIWIGTDGGGITIFNEGTKKTVCLPAGDGRNMLASGGVFAIFEDKDLRKMDRYDQGRGKCAGPSA